MTTLGALKENWDCLAQNDPLWAICTDPSKRNRGWNQEEFFSTGQAEIETVLQYISSLGLTPEFDGAALDFGCGVGRLTQALASRFAACIGVDISPTMVKTADSLNRYPGKCRYVLNDSDKLPGLGDNHFAFVYSSIVLQHIAPEYTVGYLREFARVLKPGGILVFQLPSHRRVWMGRLRTKLRLRYRVDTVLGRLGFSGRELANRIEMNCLAEDEVRKAVRNECQVVNVAMTNSCDPDFYGRFRYCNAEPSTGFVSKQYVMTKPAAVAQ